MSGRPGAARYTREQRDAIMHAHIVERLTMAETHRRAESGRLAVPAFKIPISSLREVVRHDRDSYALSNPDVMRVEIDADILAMAAAARKVAARVKAQPDPDPDLIRRAVQALTAARSAVQTTPRPGPRPAPDPTQPTAPSILHELGLSNGQPNTTT